MTIGDGDAAAASCRGFGGGQPDDAGADDEDVDIVANVLR